MSYVALGALLNSLNFSSSSANDKDTNHMTLLWRPNEMRIQNWYMVSMQ